MFTRPDGRHLDVNEFTRAFKKIRNKLGLPFVSLHDLRHTHASLLLKQATHLKIVQERLGHTIIAITADLYPHVAAGLQPDAAKAFSDALEGKQSEGLFGEMAAQPTKSPQTARGAATPASHDIGVPKAGFEPARG